MKKLSLIFIILLFTGCAKSPRETNIAVSTLLDQIQIAINEINEQTKGGSLPPFQSAEVKLSTKAGRTTEGSASLVLSGEGSKTTTDSNTITLELVPDPKAAKGLARSTGNDIAEYVIAAVKAVDEKHSLKLNTLTVEAGLEVKQITGGGIEVQLVGVTLKGKQSGESANENSLKITFAYPNNKEKN